MGSIVGIGYGTKGILGVDSQRAHLVMANAMLKRLAHRGKARGQFTICPQAILGQGADEAMSISFPNEDQPFGLVFDGDIFNQKELKDLLRQKGYTPKTEGVEPLIILLYQVFGDEFLGHLNGTFALALWDGVKGRLVLARDRIGAVPLFYTEVGEMLVFATEIKALFAHPAVKAKVDLDSFRQVLGIGPAKIPGSGVFCGIHDIKPGCFGVFDRHGFTAKSYWDIPARPHEDGYGETVETVRYLLQDAIRRQTETDKKICSLLSGGIDSSIVTAVTNDLMKEKGGSLSTYSFSFKGSKDHFVPNAFQPSLDAPFVDVMLNELHTGHTYLECDELDLVDLLGEATGARDLPGMADVDASLLYFCRQIAPHHSLAMTGECADEVFGGYPWFYREDLLLGDGFPWSKNITPRTCFLQDDLRQKLDLEGYASEVYQKAVLEVPHLEGESQAEAKRREVGYLSLRWFMCTLLDRMDRMGMASGLSARVPFADYRLIEYVFNVPWEMKRREGVEKSLLRDAMGYTLPKAVKERKKSPYPKTYHPEYEARVKTQLLRVLDDPSAPLHSIVDKAKLSETLTAPEGYGAPWFGQLMAAPQLWAYYLQINQWLTLYQPEICLK